MRDALGNARGVRREELVRGGSHTSHVSKHCASYITQLPAMQAASYYNRHYHHHVIVTVLLLDSTLNGHLIAIIFIVSWTVKGDTVFTMEFRKMTKV